MSNDARLDFCRRLAADAGRLAHGAFGRAALLPDKGRHDEVTAMDREVERVVREAISRAFAHDAILGEEDGASVDVERAEFVWIIDPIDGTANYARGIAHYCVSIGVVRDGVPVAGALHDPSHDRLYWAARGAGAWLDEGGAAPRRLAVSAVDRLTAATIECGWSLRRPQADYLALVERMLTAGCAIRRAGSGALGLADVAAGRTEGYAELHINSWDCAAGLLLVAEAGGRINDFFPGGGLLAGNPVLATNAALAEPLAALAGVPLRPDA
ncbi:MAG: inositol monophosphatase [Aquincola sp.]|nr:inositol monophosphatase [Aquincola sp.]MDH4290452.1 inositol monophosphatase [Aquincola sp.]MDH5329329.1 inositol monophosphatase [Aquincola sp.]